MAKRAFCPHVKDREDCFARRGKLCDCLQESDFKGDCPFYKPKDQYEIELKKYPHMDEKERRNKEKQK